MSALRMAAARPGNERQLLSALKLAKFAERWPLRKGTPLAANIARADVRARSPLRSRSPNE
jgi:hypothetical protein